MIRKFLLVLMVAIQALVLVGCDVLELEQGQKFTRKVTMASRYNMTYFSNVDDKKTTLLLACEVVSVDGSGNATVRATIDNIEATVSTIGLFFQFSTDKPELNTKESARPEMQKEYVGLFTGLVGKSYCAVVGKNGKVLELKEIAPEIIKYVNGNTDDKMTGPNQLIMLLSESKLKEYVSPAIYNGMPKSKVGSEIAGYEVIVPGVPKLPLYRKIVEAGDMAEATADWSEGVDKYYYSVRCEGLPGMLSNDDVVPAGLENKYGSAAHYVISVFGNGCAGYSQENGFYKHVESVKVEVKSRRADGAADTSTGRRKVRMMYTVDTIIENVD